MMTTWTRETALKQLLNVDGAFKAGTCREDDGWYRKKDLLDLREFIIRETQFLDADVVTFHQRLLYVKASLTERQTCRFCAHRLTWASMLRGKVVFTKSCLDIECKKLVKIEQITLMHKNMTPEKRAAKNKAIGVANRGSLEQRYDAQRVVEIRQNISNAQRGRIQSIETRQKRIRTRRSNNETLGRQWHTNASKQAISFSNVRTHSNTEFQKQNRASRDRGRRKQSVTMRRKIADGSFTPRQTNSWTHFDAYLLMSGQKIKFRSSWEAAFFYLTPTLLYETVRIPYEWNGNTCTYIVDFFDPVTQTLFEIKPIAIQRRPREHAKLCAGLQYAAVNNMRFIIIDETWFNTNSDVLREMLVTQPQLSVGMKQFV